MLSMSLLFSRASSRPFDIHHLNLSAGELAPKFHRRRSAVGEESCPARASANFPASTLAGGTEGVTKLGLMAYFQENHADKYLELDLESRVDRQLTLLEIRHILKEIQIEGPILDLGYGHGIVTTELLERFGSCSVVEASRRLCEVALKSHPVGLKVHHSLFEDFQPTHRYKTIFATAVLHHLKHPLEALTKFVDWLEPDGTLIISVPNGHSIHRALGYSLGIQNSIDAMTVTGKKSGVAHVLTPGAVRKMISSTRLEVVREIDSFVKILSNLQMASFSEDQLSSLFELSQIVPRDFHATSIFQCGLKSSS